MARTNEPVQYLKQMKHLTILLALTVVIGFLSFTWQLRDSGDTINPLLGDRSFVDKFGARPIATTDEDLRISTHLEHVQRMLRAKDVSDLTPELQERRVHLLELLRNYSSAGIFPRNHDHAGKRVPCFIDKDGRICAVGYLIEQTAGRQVAEKINGKHKYDKLLAMNDRSVNEWISASGLSKEECAMIQPTYGPSPNYNYNYISPAYGISSSVLGGINLSLNAINGVQIGNGSDHNAVAIISLFTGAGSIIYGVGMFPGEYGSGMYATTNESQKALSMVNIGLGTSTLIMGIWNLTKIEKRTKRTVDWNIYSFPTMDAHMGLGLSLSKRL